MDSDKDYSPYGINLDELKDTLTIGIGGTDTITLPSLGQQFGYSSASTITGGTYGAIGSVQYPNVTVTSPTGFGSPWLSSNAGSGKIRLEGDSADVEVNGWSLVAAVKRIEERLNLFQPNPELETEWADLRDLGEQYRKLEQHIRDKQATWDRLKAMPAPDID
jgi:hypothetical protein